MTETRNNIRQDWLSVPRRREEERLDPHVYKRGINGLTVEEALRRAFPRVIDILKRSGEDYSEFEQQLVRQTVQACLISQVSRANLYRIAGILVADRRDEGAHIDTSLALAYVAALREAFLTELSVGERAQTPPSSWTTTTRSGSLSRGYPAPARPFVAPHRCHEVNDLMARHVSTSAFQLFVF